MSLKLPNGYWRTNDTRTASRRKRKYIKGVDVKKVILELDEYEVENILKSLALTHYAEISTHGKWEKQKDSNGYWYSSTKKSKQLAFTQRNIERQTKIKSCMSIISVRDF